MPADLTVILCTYNRAFFLPWALKSLRDQQGARFRVLVVDDGSTDETLSVLAGAVAELFSTEVFCLGRNGGIGAARNAALGRARTEWVTFLDSDDAYAPGHLAEYERARELHPEVDLFHGSAEVIGDRWVRDKDDPAKKVDVAECIIGGTFLLRREKALALGGFPEDCYGDDSFFFAQAREAGWKIHFLGQTGYRYHRDHESSLTKTIL
ncbi:MAG: glycosyltransferase family 2 protein [Opitutales bacterium]|nr:glycosyltransferase family 2 protein [Opitutales bacterium]MCH8539944.1 glycosyltransferase family 2 protein [Opitutales bacterium]